MWDGPDGAVPHFCLLYMNRSHGSTRLTDPLEGAARRSYRSELPRRASAGSYRGGSPQAATAAGLRAERYVVFIEQVENSVEILDRCEIDSNLALTLTHRYLHAGIEPVS